MNKQLLKSLLYILFSAISVPACKAPPPPTFPHELARVYGELLALHEKEKITGTTSDSSYQIKVKEFFAEKKIDEREFRNHVEEISHDDNAWRKFLTEATTTLDSIKAVKQ